MIYLKKKILVNLRDVQNRRTRNDLTFVENLYLTVAASF